MTNHASAHDKFQILAWGFQRSVTFTPHHVSCQICLLVVVAAALCYPAMAAVKNVLLDSLRYQSGVRNSAEHALNPKQVEKLLNSLREKTGFLQMQFDESGFLRLGDRSNPKGGSATARELLIAAVDRAIAIDLENHDRSPRLAFAQLARPLVFASMATGARIEVFPIQIDFSDFAHLRGDKAVLAAFDVGFVVLHELAHAALGLHDSIDEREGPGECEEYINRIRRELGLPERQNYVARTHQSRSLQFGTPGSRAELFFARTTEPEGRTKSFPLSLTWEADLVGANPIPDSRVSSMASTRRTQESGSSKASLKSSVAAAP